eukprot:gene16899-biopygen20327
MFNCCGPIVNALAKGLGNVKTWVGMAFVFGVIGSGRMGSMVSDGVCCILHGVCMFTGPQNEIDHHHPSVFEPPFPKKTRPVHILLNILWGLLAAAKRSGLLLPNNMLGHPNKLGKRALDLANASVPSQARAIQ